MLKAKRAFIAKDFRKCYHFANEIEPKNEQIYILMAKSALEFGELRKSESAFLCAFQLNPNLPIISKSLIEIYEKLENYPSKLEYMAKFAKILASNKKLDKAIDTYQELANFAEKQDFPLQSYLACEDIVHLLLEHQEELQAYCSENPDARIVAWYNVYRLLNMDITQTLIKKEKLEVDVELRKRECRVAMIKCGSVVNWETCVVPQKVMEKCVSVYVQNLEMEIERTDQLKRDVCCAAIDTCVEIFKWFPNVEHLVMLIIRLGLLEELDAYIGSEMYHQCVQVLKLYFDKNPWVKLINVVNEDTPDDLKKWETDVLRNLEKQNSMFPAWCRLIQMAATPGSILHDPKKVVEYVKSANAINEKQYAQFGFNMSAWNGWKKTALVYQSQAHCAMGEEDQAIKCFEDFLADKNNEQHVEFATVEYAECLLRLNRTEKAVFILRQLNNANTNVSITNAWVLYKSNDLQDAKALLEAIIEGKQITNKARLALALYRFAKVCKSLQEDWWNDKKRGLATLVHAAKADPTLPSLFTEIGLWYVSCDTTNEGLARAEKCFVKALHFYPNDEIAGNQLCFLLKEKNDTKQLQTTLQNLLEKCSTAKWALLQLAQIEMNENSMQCLITLQRAIRVEPKDKLVWASLGFAYSKYGKYMAAYKSLTRTMELGCKTNAVLCEFSRVALALGLHEESYTCISRVALDENALNVDCIAYTKAAIQFEMAKKLFTDGYIGKSQKILLHGIYNLKKHVFERQISRELYLLHLLLGDMYTFSHNSPTMQNGLDTLLQGASCYRKILEVVKCPKIIGALNHRLAVNLIETSRQASSLDEFSCVALLQEASVECVNCLKFNPENSLYWIAFAETRRDKLVKHFCLVRATELDPENSASFSSLFYFYVTHNAFELAREAMIALQVVDPNSSAVWYGHAKLKQQCQASSYLEDLQCSLQNQPEPQFLLEFAVGCLLFQKFYHEALSAIVKYMEYVRDGDLTFWIHGLLLERVGQVKAAMDVYEARKGISKRFMVRYLHCMLHLGLPMGDCASSLQDCTVQGTQIQLMMLYAAQEINLSIQLIERNSEISTAEVLCLNLWLLKTALSDGLKNEELKQHMQSALASSDEGQLLLKIDSNDKAPTIVSKVNLSENFAENRLEQLLLANAHEYSFSHMEKNSTSMNDFESAVLLLGHPLDACNILIETSSQQLPKTKEFLYSRWIRYVLLGNPIVKISELQLYIFMYPTEPTLRILLACTFIIQHVTSNEGETRFLDKAQRILPALSQTTLDTSMQKIVEKIQSRIKMLLLGTSHECTISSDFDMLRGASIARNLEVHGQWKEAMDAWKIVLALGARSSQKQAVELSLAQLLLHTPDNVKSNLLRTQYYAKHCTQTVQYLAQN